MEPTTIFTNAMFAGLLGFVAYLLFIGVNDKYLTWRAQREKAARLAFLLAIREGRPRSDARRAYKEVKREWTAARRSQHR
ncbi:hypothetical protein GCM10010423_64760 [Streptomyces levis]|uniref:Uncharacterized protein n=1 Tax=Streptomyces levis TaxID=285566 RepID=A0ABN3P0W6_9ACTN